MRHSHKQTWPPLDYTSPNTCTFPSSSQPPSHQSGNSPKVFASFCPNVVVPQFASDFILISLYLVFTVLFIHHLTCVSVSRFSLFIINGRNQKTYWHWKLHCITDYLSWWCASGIQVYRISCYLSHTHYTGKSFSLHIEGNWGSEHRGCWGRKT